MTARNAFGFPMPEQEEEQQPVITTESVVRLGFFRRIDKSNGERLVVAQARAAEIRARNFPPPCECEQCVSVARLPSVQRLLANWVMKDGE